MGRSWWLSIWGRVQAKQCVAPACTCPHGLLFVWLKGVKGWRGDWRSRVFYELRTRDGQRFQGSAPSDKSAIEFGSATLGERGLQRMRVVFGRPEEVPRA